MNLYARLFAIVIAINTACISCTATKVNRSTTTQQMAKATICDQVIKYASEKLRITDGGREIAMESTFTIDPDAKTISVFVNDPDKGKGNFVFTIESMDCQLAAGLTAGTAVYKGYITQEDGSTTPTVFNVELKNDEIIIHGATPDKPAEFYMIIARWEIITN